MILSIIIALVAGLLKEIDDIFIEKDNDVNESIRDYKANTIGIVSGIFIVIVIETLIYYNVISTTMISVILSGIIASVIYALVGYAKECVAKNESFDYEKSLTTVFIGLIIGILMYVFGYDAKTATDYANVMFMVIGGNVIVEKIYKMIMSKFR